MNAAKMINFMIKKTFEWKKKEIVIKKRHNFVLLSKKEKAEQF